ncbi:hypothetical protein [Streptomyces sp. NPDC089915]|uniref:hypothetical protein n=1 Tax=Streptomyces sp. NPDC089915 TaxID=3155186 RepID=UPI003429F723
MNSTGIERGRLARNTKEYHDLLASQEDWFARTPEDVEKLRKNRHHPLANLSHEEFKSFREGLTFRSGGMIAGYYKPLMSLPMTQMFEVFESFGLSREFFTDEEHSREDCCLEYRMIAPGVCEFDFWSYCLED